MQLFQEKILFIKLLVFYIFPGLSGLQHHFNDTKASISRSRFSPACKRLAFNPLLYYQLFLWSWTSLPVENNVKKPGFCPMCYSCFPPNDSVLLIAFTTLEARALPMSCQQCPPCRAIVRFPFAFFFSGPHYTFPFGCQWSTFNRKGLWVCWPWFTSRTPCSMRQSICASVLVCRVNATQRGFFQNGVMAGSNIKQAGFCTHLTLSKDFLILPSGCSCNFIKSTVYLL